MNKALSKAGAVTAISFMTFLVAGTILSRVGFGETLSYVAAYFCALSAVRFGAEFVPEEYREQMSFDGEFAEDDEKKEKHRGGFFVYLTLSCAAVTALMLAANAAVGIVLGGTSAASLTPLGVLASVAIKPFCEETLFRGAYVSLLRRGGASENATAFVTAALFAAIHKGSAVIFAFFAGVLLARLVLRVSERAGREKRHRRVAAVSAFAVHGIYNLILCAASAVL